MSEPKKFNLAIVGDGSTAVNALDALLNTLEKAPRPVNITLYGKAAEADVGKGFAYGPTGSRYGNLTEPVSKGHADYTPEKGAFAAYHGQHPGTELAPRQSIGEFHAQRYRDAKEKAAKLGVTLTYRQGEVTDITGTPGQRQIVTADGASSAPVDHVVLAVGDMLSQRFRDTADQFPGRVSPTPYHAIDSILEQHNRPDAVVVGFGTRSSFTDLANGLKAEGFQGTVIGVSTSGQTSWPTTPNPEALYQPKFLTPSAPFRNTQAVLRALGDELKSAARNGAYVPPSLIENIQKNANSTQPERLRWDFDPQAENTHAGGVTYHQVAQGIDWEGIQQRLPEREKEPFARALGDFIVYNRVNRIVSADFSTLAGHLKEGSVKIEKGSIDPNNIKQGADGKLQITLDTGKTITADILVNAAIGPVPALEQIKQSPLLKNLTKASVLTPHKTGTGFDLAASDISVVGAQARTHSFAGLGIETYGRQITQNLIPNLTQTIDVTLNNAPTNTISAPTKALTRRYTHG